MNTRRRNKLMVMQAVNNQRAEGKTHHQPDSIYFNITMCPICKEEYGFNQEDTTVPQIRKIMKGLSQDPNAPFEISRKSQRNLFRSTGNFILEPVG